MNIRHQLKFKKALCCLLLLASCSLLVNSNANADLVFFSANFDGTPVADIGGTIGYGAALTATNLDAGTAIGTWAVNQAQSLPTLRTQRMIQTNGGANVTNKALRFGIGLQGTISLNNAVLTANLASSLSLSNTINVSFDQGYISTDGGSDRITYLTGLDGSDKRLFQIGFVNENSPGGQLGYFSSAGVWTLIGSAGDLIGNNNTFWSATLMKNVTVDVGASTYDIKLAGNSLTGGSGIAFRDATANGLSKLAFSSNTPHTGSAFDNITVSQLPEPSAAVLGGLGFLLLLLRRRLEKAGHRGFLGSAALPQEGT